VPDHQSCQHTHMCDFECTQENVVCQFRPMHAMYIKTKQTQTQRKEKWKITRPVSNAWKCFIYTNKSILLYSRDLESVNSLAIDQCCSTGFSNEIWNSEKGLPKSRFKENIFSSVRSDRRSWKYDVVLNTSDKRLEGVDRCAKQDFEVVDASLLHMLHNSTLRWSRLFASTGNDCIS
jgi:hypothetical protein